MKLALGICGASGAQLGIKFANILESYSQIKLFVVISNGAKKVLDCENNNEFGLKSSAQIFSDDDLSAPLSSGSFGINKTAIIPCSMNSLAKINAGINDTLITRMAAVALKERRDLLLAPREMPFCSIMLKNMLDLSKLGVIIAPPILGYYSNARNLEEMEHFLFGKWLDSLGIKNHLYNRWKEN